LAAGASGLSAVSIKAGLITVLAHECERAGLLEHDLGSSANKSIGMAMRCRAARR
jgi:hypothetical protein